MAAGGNLDRLRFREKLGYSMADGAAQFVFSMMLSYQNFFYTNTMRIDPVWAGSLILIPRLWDAFFDPMMGFIADRTKTRWGRFRPYLLWTAIPWAIAMVLAYTVPGFGSLGTFLYALITNIVLMTIYSMNNTPYSALMAVMTGNVKERTRLSQYRFIVAMVGQLVVGGFTMAMVDSYSSQHFVTPSQQVVDSQLVELKAKAQAKIDAGDLKAVMPAPQDTQVWKDAKQKADAYGWQVTISIFAVICVFCFLITFLTVKERIEPDLKQKSSVKLDLNQLLKNGPWMAMFLVTITHYVLSGMRGPTYIYYFKYVLDRNAMLAFVNSWGLPVATDGVHSLGYKVLDNFHLIISSDKDHSNLPGVANGLLQMTLKVCSVIGIIAASALIAKFNKRIVVILSLLLNTVFIFALFFVPYTSIWGVFTVEWLGALAYAPTVPLLWVLFADVVDYSEWKSHRRITGLIYATFFFAVKAGLSLGGAMASWILGGFGYGVDKPITPAVVLGIVLTLTVFPGVFSTGCAMSMLLYKITKKMNQEISDELAQRRVDLAQEAAAEQGLAEPQG